MTKVICMQFCILANADVPEIDLSLSPPSRKSVLTNLWKSCKYMVRLYYINVLHCGNILNVYNYKYTFILWYTEAMNKYKTRIVQKLQISYYVKKAEELRSTERYYNQTAC